MGNKLLVENISTLNLCIVMLNNTYVQTRAQTKMQLFREEYSNIQIQFWIFEYSFQGKYATSSVQYHFKCLILHN